MQIAFSSATLMRQACVALTSLWLAACGGGDEASLPGGTQAAATYVSTSGVGPPAASAAADHLAVVPAPPPVAGDRRPASEPVDAAQQVGPGSMSNIATLADGQQVVAWKDESNVCWRRYTRQSMPADGAQCIQVARAFGPASVAALGTGFVLAWLEADSDAYDSSHSIKTQVFGPAGELLGPVRSRLASFAGAGFSSATLVSGEVAIAYRDVEHIRLLRVDAGGNVTAPIGPQLDSGSGLAIPAGGRVAALADGGFVVVWDELGPAVGRVIHMRLFDANFQPRSAEIVVAADGDAFGAVPSPLRDGGFVMMWEGTGAGVQRFTADGVAVGPRRLLDEAWMLTPPDTCFVPRPTSCPRQQAGVSLVGTSDGGWVAMWNNLDGRGTSQGTFAMRFAAGGAATSAPVRMEMALTPARSYPVTIAAPGDGDGFVLTWNTRQTDSSTGTSVDAAWLQRFPGSAIR
jgi:hypothetical protein